MNTGLTFKVHTTQDPPLFQKKFISSYYLQLKNKTGKPTNKKRLFESSEAFQHSWKVTNYFEM